MSRPTHLSLCSGYGGIDMALSAVFGCRTVAVADIDSGPRKILAHRFPRARNIGDISAVDWTVFCGRIRIISGGTPCQDLSTAGRMAGMTEGTRSNLWVHMREAIRVIKPDLVVWENVRGAYSTKADSSMEQCTRCVGNPALGSRARRRHDQPRLRALGRVLGDLSAIGYDAIWYGLRASDVGAAHHRFRVFVFAWPADSPRDAWRVNLGNTAIASHRSGLKALPTPTATSYGHNRSDSPGAAIRPSLSSLAKLFPSPSAYDGSRGGAQSPEQRRAGGHSVTLNDVASFLPTPVTTDLKSPGPADYDRHSMQLRSLHSVGAPRWAEYESAIRRQEISFGRPAPQPTEINRNGNSRLSPRFAEWLMGLPDGWVTDVPGITRTEALKAIGGGVVPQQLEAAAQMFVKDFNASRKFRESKRNAS